jgi:hypothetical protein
MNLPPKFAASLSVEIKALLAMVKPSDLDGLSIVLDMSLQGKMPSIADIIKALKEKCPGLVDLIKMLVPMLSKLADLIASLFGKLSDAAKQLLKKVYSGVYSYHFS